VALLYLFVFVIPVAGQKCQRGANGAAYVSSDVSDIWVPIVVGR
jgi:hypothetical protein